MNLLAIFVAAALTGSATNQLVWPPPPAAPRIQYVKSITGPADLGIHRSLWGKLGDWITGNTHADQFVKPLGVTCTDSGDLLFTDTGLNSVAWFDTAHKTYQRWDKIGPYRLASPVAMAKRGDRFYVADSAWRAVFAFDAKGKLQTVITNRLDRPAGLAMDGDNLFVADAGAHQIAVFDSAGKPLARFGRRGAAAGEFNYPTHIAPAGKGRLLVTDSMNCRVQILSTNGSPLGVIGSIGDSSGHFSRPKGVAVDSAGNVYVADAGFDNVQIFDQQGKLLLYFGAAGKQPGEFWLPAGVAINRNNQIYVADTYNRRIQVFQYVGQP